MNKKYITFGFIGLFAMAIASAAIIEYYGTIQQEVSIESSIIIDGNTPVAISGFGGQAITGDIFTITNEAPFEIQTQITNDAPEGIDVEYKGILILSKKIVDFEDTNWTLTGDSLSVEYTIVGDSFNAEVVTPKDGYELVYYMDNLDRFNNPATVISIQDVEGNLPYAEDGNAEDYNMCEVEGYTNCNGAKIWYIPSDAIDGGVVDWDRASEFYFETNLIQYNEDGNVVVYDNLDVTPVYTIANTYVGDDVITTKILPTA